MLFNSLSFLIFFPIVVFLYYTLPQRFRWIMLLMASCAFYMFFIPYYILILILTIVVDYFAGIYIEQSQGRRRKVYLWVSIVTTCLILFYFKYYNFFINSINDLLHITGSQKQLTALNIILPIGLSFHTFQSLSYVIEVYYGRQKAESHFGIYSLYVMFFPQLVAGPIERPQNVLHQFYEHHPFKYDQVTAGIKQMAWGFFKKVVIADRLAMVANPVYNDVHHYSGLPLVLATLFFTFQIYCDFSGYSDIALGSARVMGFRLMTNFDRPYFSATISEFWRRWHISLSTWFRDYVYIPLGGNRVGKTRHYINLLITFTISGFWHGANWTFVAWGALHGIFLIVTAWMKPDLSKWYKRWFSTFITFILVYIGWIFFRANNIHEAAYVIEHLFAVTGTQVSSLIHSLLHVKAAYNGLWEGIPFLHIVLGLLLIVVLLTTESISFKINLYKKISGYPGIVRWSLYTVFLYGIIILGVFGYNAFIYFQF